MLKILRKLNVFDPEANKRRVAALDVYSGEVKTSDGKKRHLEDFQDVKFFEAYKNGKQVKQKRCSH